MWNTTVCVICSILAYLHNMVVGNTIDIDDLVSHFLVVVQPNAHHDLHHDIIGSDEVEDICTGYGCFNTMFSIRNI